jgi:hypothetical protein
VVLSAAGQPGARRRHELPLALRRVGELAVRSTARRGVLTVVTDVMRAPAPAEGAQPGDGKAAHVSGAHRWYAAEARAAVGHAVAAVEIAEAAAVEAAAQAAARVAAAVASRAAAAAPEQQRRFPELRKRAAPRE